MKKNSEVRSQNQDARSSLRDAARSSLLRRSTLPLRYQSGIQTRDFLIDHQIFNLVGVQKRRLFRRSLRDAKSERRLALSEAMPLAQPLEEKALRCAIRFFVQNSF
ncbi:hypothetical protein [Nostoc sp.]|uniref:hypothetical protein n=1 Tax=Nostoc sp. TaxID=1180 RepID=UPI002FFD5617